MAIPNPIRRTPALLLEDGQKTVLLGNGGEKLHCYAFSVVTDNKNIVSVLWRMQNGLLLRKVYGPHEEVDIVISQIE